jgi:protoporphyrinogen oxidase
MRPYYDYIIVGAGPAGLALAQYLRHSGQSILILDSMEVVGGCHRVVRVPYQKEHQLFTEHGPRIYVSNYKNFQYLLKDMGHDFHSLFTPYRYSIQGEMIKRITLLSVREWTNLMGAFVLFLTDEHYGKKSTIQQFGKKHGFSRGAMDLLDRVARMTDGAGSERYTMNMLFQLLNQGFFYGIYQPRLPNDVGLFRVWENFLQDQPNIDILLEHDVVHLSYNKEVNSIQSIWAVDKKNHNTIEIKAHQVVLAVPPHAMARILKTCDDKVKNSFMPYPKLEKFVQNTNYNPYISITFHWDTKQDNAKKIHGFSVGEWGVMFIVLSDYMDMRQEYSKTLISSCVSYLDRPSSHTGKTANQSTADEVIEETFRQLKTVMPLLQKPDVALISPQNSYDEKRQVWTQYDVSYFSSSKEKRMKNKGAVKNLYNVGVQNGHSMIALTTLEAAVSNAWGLACQLEPSTPSAYPYQKFWTLRDVVKIIAVIVSILFMILVVFLATQNTNRQPKTKNK